MIHIKSIFTDLRSFLILWSTQSFSELGSAMTNFALVIWAYGQTGSAITTALLSICSYAPYILLSIFAGTISDKWNKKITMLASDSIAAAGTLLIFFLLQTDSLQIGHLYIINSINGLMNTVQQPASDTMVSLLAPKKYYQQVGGMRSFSNSLITILTPVLAAAFLSFAGIRAVLIFDLLTFSAAFLSLLFLIPLPSVTESNIKKDSFWRSAADGLRYLKKNRGILNLILFLAAINLTASMYNAVLAPMILSRNGGGEDVLGWVNTFTGLAALAGSILVTVLPAPKNRIRVICNALLFSMSTENFLLALGRNAPVWCLGAVLGWICIPFMNANMDVILRKSIPIEMQGRIYAARNTLQFFTIPLGYLLGGILTDAVFEPFMSGQTSQTFLGILFGTGKGSGAAMLFMLIGVSGVCTCLFFRKDKHILAFHYSQKDGEPK